MRWPFDAVVSADVSPSDRKPAIFSAIVAMMLRRSRQAVEPRHLKHVAGVELIEKAAEPGANGLECENARNNGPTREVNSAT
jgi:hypothetical protein